MMGTTYPVVLLPPEDGKDMFKAVRNNLRGDLVFGNLEGPLVDECLPIKCIGAADGQCYEFMTPTRYAMYLKEAGFNTVSITNNHTLDCGAAGISSTLKTLRNAGIGAAGGESLSRMNIKDKKIVVASFSFKAHQYSYSILDIEEAVRIVTALKEENDIVIVSFHGGQEGKSALRVQDVNEVFLGEPRGNVVRFSHAVIDAGAALVLGHGPHVLRALELYKGKLIAYSLGNFLTYGMFNLKGPNGLSIILRISLDAATGDFIAGEAVPVKLLNGGIPEPDPDGEAITLVQDLIRRDTGNSGIGLDRHGQVGIIKKVGPAIPGKITGIAE